MFPTLDNDMYLWIQRIQICATLVNCAKPINHYQGGEIDMIRENVSVKSSGLNEGAWNLGEEFSIKER